MPNERKPIINEPWEVVRRQIAMQSAKIQPPDYPKTTVYDTPVYCDFIEPIGLQVCQEGIAKVIVDAVNASFRKKVK